VWLAQLSSLGLDILRWDRKFDETIELPDGRKLILLLDATSYITALPKKGSAAPSGRPRFGGADAGARAQVYCAATAAPMSGRCSKKRPQRGQAPEAGGGRRLTRANYRLMRASVYALVHTGTSFFPCSKKGRPRRGEPRPAKG